MAPLDVPPAPAEADVTSYSGLDIADTGVEEGSNTEENQTAAVSDSREPLMDLLRRTRPLFLVRPQMQRNESGPPPPEQQPPLPPPPSQDQGAGSASDSLSLAQLKRLVNEVPRVEARAYEFTYDDAASFESEIEEWFSYADEERTVLLSQKAAFERRWLEFNNNKQVRWADIDQDARKEFIKRESNGLERPSIEARRTSLQALLYIALGAWAEITEQEQSKWENENAESKGERTKLQLDRMLDYTLLIVECDGLPSVYHLLQQACLRGRYISIVPTLHRALTPGIRNDDNSENQSSGNADPHTLEEPQDVNNLFTFFYLVIEAGRRQQVLNGETSIRDRLGGEECAPPT